MATDALSTTLQVGNGFATSSQSPADLLVAAYKASRQGPVVVQKKKQKTLEAKQVYFNSMRTKITNLNQTIADFSTDTVSKKFSTRKVTSSDATVANVTADGTATVGISSLKVDRLASNDVLISSRKTLADVSAINGAQAFQINGINYNINVETTDTNESVFKKVVSAVNLNKDSKVSAAFVKDTTATGKLTLTAKTTGAENAVTYTTSNILDQLGITAGLRTDPAARTIATGVGAGFRNANVDNLDSKANVNGIDIQRGTNSITDVLPGLTINLTKAQAASDTAINLTTEVDVAKLKDNIKPILDAYNDTLKYVTSTILDVPKDESLVKGLASRLRNLPGQQITSSGSDIDYLSEIGIKTAKDGTMSFGDDEKLKALLESDPVKIEKLFTGSDGFVEKLKKSIENLSGANNSLDGKSDSLRKAIESTSKQTKSLESRIDIDATRMLKQYTKLQQLYSRSQNQYGALSSIIR